MIRGSGILVVAKRTRGASETLFRGPFFFAVGSITSNSCLHGLNSDLAEASTVSNPENLVR